MCADNFAVVLLASSCQVISRIHDICTTYVGSCHDNLFVCPPGNSMMPVALGCAWHGADLVDSLPMPLLCEKVAQQSVSAPHAATCGMAAWPPLQCLQAGSSSPGARQRCITSLMSFCRIQHARHDTQPCHSTDSVGQQAQQQAKEAQPG